MLIPFKTKTVIIYKGKGHSIKGHEGTEGKQMYSYTLSLTSALDGVDLQRHAPAALPAGKNLVPIVQEAAWYPGTVWTGAENLAPTMLCKATQNTRQKDKKAIYKRILNNQ